MTDNVSRMKQTAAQAGKWTGVAFAAVAALSVTSGTALAQDGVSASAAAQSGFAKDKRDLTEPRSTQTRLGGFLFDGSAVLSAIYEDNVFFEAVNEADDLRFELRPQINLRSNFPRHWLNANLGGEVGVYTELSDDNFFHGKFGIDSGLNMTRQWDLRFGANINSSTERRGDDDEGRAINLPTEPVRRTVVGAVIGSQVRFVRVELDGSIGYRNLNYSDADTNIGTLDQDDRDRDVLSVDGSVTVEATPRLSPYVGFGVSDIDYANPDALANGVAVGPERDGNHYYVVAGVNFDFTGLLLGQAAIGYQERSFDNAGFEDVSGPRFDVNLTWLPTKMMSVDWTLNSTVGDTTLSNSGGYDSIDTELQFSYEVIRHLTVGAHVGFDNRDYNSTPREDDRWRAGLGATYVFSRYVSGNFRYRFVDRDSTDAAFNYTQNVVNLNLVTHF